MSGVVRSERGFTLVELLVAMTLMLVVLSATLTSFNAFSNNVDRNAKFNDQQDQARTILDQIVRQTRNLANPTTGTPGAPASTIAFADEGRLVFQTTDPQKQWVSYCLNTGGTTTTPPTSPTRETIWYQTTANNSLTPSTVASTMVSGCPSGSGSWQTTRRVADFVTNQANSSVDRPFFQYYSDTGQLPSSNPTPPSSVAASDLSKIVRVRTSVFMKLDPSRPPAETQLSSAAYMRNQNQSPTASFVVTISGSQYTFDAGGSSDPEGRTLDYNWYTAPRSTSITPDPTALPDCSTKNPSLPSGWGCLGTSVVLTNKTFPSATDVFLRVTDPGGLTSLTPVSGGSCPSVSSTRVSTVCGQIP
jgi:prepilin-type N-terminal cleavage/methylation domain-containing protein